MADITANVTNYDSVQADFRAVKVETPATATSDDTIDITLSNYGATKIDGVVGFHHSTENSVVEQEQPTTAVSDGVLTLTVGGTSSTGKKVYIVYVS